MNVDQAEGIFNLLYRDIDGFTISMNNRRRLNLESKELTYGEITLPALIKILDQVHPKDDDIFYDLGCGTGKVVIAAALLRNWKKVCGVEILDDVYLKADAIKTQFENYMRDHNLNHAPISLIHGDLKKYDFSDADVIYIASTCFDYQFMDEFGKKCETLKPGSRIVTLTKEIKNPHIVKKVTLTVPMTWGDSTVHVYERS